MSALGLFAKLFFCVVTLTIWLSEFATSKASIALNLRPAPKTVEKDFVDGKIYADIWAGGTAQEKWLGNAPDGTVANARYF